jgi:hypothetical protein
MGCGLLNISERNTCVESNGDEAVTQRMWRDHLVDTCLLCESPNNTRGLMAVHPFSVIGLEDWPGCAFSCCEVHGAGCAWCERCNDCASSFAQHTQRVLTALQPKIVDITAQRF